MVIIGRQITILLSANGPNRDAVQGVYASPRATDHFSFYSDTNVTYQGDTVTANQARQQCPGQTGRPSQGEDRRPGNRLLLQLAAGVLFLTQLLNLVPHPWASLWEENCLMRKGLHLVQDFILSERAQVKYLQETLAFLASSPIFLISFSPLLPAAPSFSPL